MNKVKKVSAETIDKSTKALIQEELIQPDTTI